MYYPFVRKALFQLDPERAHEFTFQQLRRITGTPLAALVRQNVPEKPVQCMGLTFKNPLGLAAGEQLLLLYELARGIRAADGRKHPRHLHLRAGGFPHCKAEGAQSGARRRHRLQPRHARLFQIYRHVHRRSEPRVRRIGLCAASAAGGYSAAGGHQLLWRQVERTHPDRRRQRLRAQHCEYVFDPAFYCYSLFCT